jgi:hypothetical protein
MTKWVHLKESCVNTYIFLTSLTVNKVVDEKRIIGKRALRRRRRNRDPWSRLHPPPHVQGCQMVSFQTKNPNLGKFWRTLDWKMLIYFMAI